MPNRIARAWSALTGADIKARGVNSPPLSGLWRHWLAGPGVPFVPAGARVDYAREAGRLELNAVVAICLGWLYDNVPKAQLKVGTRQAGGEYEALDAHPLYEIVKRPNPVFSWQETLGGIVSDFKIDGNAYLLKARDRNGRGNVAELWWLPNRQVVVKTNPDPSAPHPVEKYEVTFGSVKRDYEPQDIVHFRDMPDPENPVVGLGRVKRQLRAVAGVNAGDTLTAAALRNAHTGIVLVPKEPLGEVIQGSHEETVQHAEMRALRNSLGGENYGGVRAASLPMEYVRYGYTPEELMLDKILDRPEAFITAAMGLNSLVLGLPSSRDTRTYSNLAEARRQAWEDGIVPTLGNLADGMQSQLLYATDASGVQYAEFGDGPGLECWFDTDDVPALQDDAEAKTTRVVMVYNAGLAPKSWAREALGIELTPEQERELEAESQLPQIGPDGQPLPPDQQQQPDQPEPDQPDPGADANA